MNLLTILLFFVYTYGLGYAASFFIKEPENPFERWFIRIGIGLGIIPVLVVLFDLIGIPIDWKIFLGLSLIAPLIVKIKEKSYFPKIKVTRASLIFLGVFILFILTLTMYTKGAFSYPYFENDDPWAHATGVKYIAIEKHVDDPHNQLKYLVPYPPGFDGLMGMLHQTSPELMWTMKFFNALILSLSIIFFYLFTKTFVLNRTRALVATAILAMIPSYMSHFIWAHSLVVCLLFVALFCILSIKENKGWIYPTILVVAGICLTQPTQPIKFFVLFAILLLVKLFFDRKIPIREIIAVGGGYLLSFMWWIIHWKDMFFKEAGKNMANNPASQGSDGLWGLIKGGFPPNSGSATRPYSFNDFFVAQGQNMINNPIGWGVFLTLLLIFSIILILITYKSMKKTKKQWIIVTLLWFVFTYLGVNSMTFNLPIGFFGFRFWMLLAIPLALICTEGFMFLLQILRGFKIPRWLTAAVLLVLLFATSGAAKWAVNTSVWGAGQIWTSGDEVAAYTWLKQLEPDTKVFAMSGDEPVIGFGAYSCMWCDNVVEFRKELLYREPSEIYDFLKQNQYEYFIVGGRAFRNFEYFFGANDTNTILPGRIEAIGSTQGFSVAYQNQGAVIFRVS